MNGPEVRPSGRGAARGAGSRATGAAGSVMLLLFAAMPWLAPRPGSVAPFMALFTASFVLYLVVVRAVLRRPEGEDPARSGSAGLRTVVILACLFRGVLLFAPPALSSDLMRYRWDGRVILSGRNPYAEFPAAEALADLRDADYERMDHHHVRTVYPPLAQAIFALGAAAPGAAGFKTLIVAADLLAILALRRLLAVRGLPERRVLLYAWNPLVVIEGAWSGHLEPAAILLALLGTTAIIQNRDRAGAALLTAGGLVKIVPFLWLAALARVLRPRAWIVPPLVVLAACLPFAGAGPRLFGGLRAYAKHWSANESLFALVRAGLEWIDPAPPLKAAIAGVRARVPGTALLDSLYTWVHPEPLARILCGAAFVIWAACVVRRGADPPRACLALTTGWLVLAPTVHPWYLLWLVPWLCLVPSPALILWTGLVVLAYANLGAPGRAAEPYPWIRWVEYAPFYVLLGFDAWRGRGRRPPRPRVLNSSGALP